MHRVSHLVLGATGLILMLWVGGSWGGPVNTTPSDDLENTAGGLDALLSNTTGSLNTASGVNTLFSNTTGGNNTAIGGAALQNSTGDGNIAVGTNAGSNLMNGNNNIYLGHQGVATESGMISLGTPGVHTTTFIAGDVFANSFTGSDIRLKTHVTPLTHMLEKLTQLRGVSFEWNEAAASLTGHTPGQRNLGVIAQEVEALFPELVITGPDGYKAVAYGKLTAVLITAVKELDAAMAAQEARLTALEPVSRGGNTPA
jgi:Chaperone of endosialidase